MKKSFYCFLAFILVQYVCYVLVNTIWSVCTAEGKSFIDALSWDRSIALQPTVLLVNSAVSSVITLLLFLHYKWTEVSSAWLRTRHWDVCVWSGVAALGTLVPCIWLQEQLPELPDFSADLFKQVMSSQYGYFVLCVFAPFVEEVVFRGAILRSMLSAMSNRWLAIFVSALFFAAAHMNPAQMPHALLVGLLLGWFYARTGSIIPSVAFHWVNNTATYAIYVLMPQAEDMTLLQFFGGNSVRVALAILFSMFLLLPALYQLNLRMCKAK